MTSPRINRLMILADHMKELASVKKAHIDMGMWGDPGELHLKDIKRTPRYNRKLGFDTGSGRNIMKTGNLPEGFCGSVACVAGWATANEKLRKLGLRFSITWFDSAVSGTGRLEDYDFQISYVEEGVRYTSFRALSLFFGIPYTHAELLFGANRQTEEFYGRNRGTPKKTAIAKRLAEYVANPASTMSAFNEYYGKKYGHQLEL